MKFATKVDRILSESVLDYIILTADTYVGSGFDDSGWKRVKFFVRTDDASVAMRAVKVWLQQTEISRFRNLNQVGRNNNVPEGDYDNVMDERGEYIEPDRRNIIAQY